MPDRLPGGLLRPDAPVEWQGRLKPPHGPAEEMGLTFSEPPRTPVKRAIYRAPIWCYRLGLGGLLGHRFVLLTHIGRKSGRPRQVVLEVAGYHRESGGFLVASGYGARSQWFRNILHRPRVRFQIGWRRYEGTARPLPAEESGRSLAEYARRHPRAAASLLRALGLYVDGSAANYERVGSDPEHGVPVVLLRPAPRG
ncbi:nitroreductase family deazaflavin-dependent oxidoreductase [Allosalinactinospora lopnorensis]|uniref:nitroreductase family deazaflavin-dependent oxidoreductase n=1 Tax=Allosalinactinospora lopnorensis TaxID=1352348 RepID=UPI001F01AC82|nr:nitroreductase family deazaflavin-dependent oxidoreductase [Allosalinactinospora lopnorensis]